MPGATRDKISELRQLITRMPLQVFCFAVLPEFNIRWYKLARAVRSARLQMQPASIARVLCKHLSETLTADELDDIIARLRLKLVAIQPRIWHVIRLLDKVTDEGVTMSMRAVSGRITQALRKNKRSMRPEVQTVLLGDLMYLSVQLVSEYKAGSTLYVATPPGEPVALVSSVTGVGLIKAAVEGLGYKKYEKANLFGRDIKSLLRINDRSWNANAEHLANIPEYNPTPVMTKTGIDYTYKNYDVDYVENILGPSPPVITDLNIETTKLFFDRSVLDKNMKMSVNLTTGDLADTLKSWVAKGAISPKSDFVQIFHQMKSNKINYSVQDSDED